MKRAVLSAFLGLALCFNFPFAAFAQGPTMPDLEGKSNEEAAALVNEYNAKVEAYNQQVDKDYDQAVQEYNEALAYNEEAKKHNAQEDAAVAEVNAANAAEQARVDAANEELRANYEKDLATYNSKVGNDAAQNAEPPKYKEVHEGKTTYYYDNDGKLLYKSVAGATAKDDIVTYENVGTTEKPVWSNKYDYNGANKRYVNFSIISVIGKTTTGTDWDNDASKYSNKVYSTIANLNNVTGVPLNYNDPGEGRNLINYLTKVDGQAIGLEQCDTIIRSLATIALDTYFNKANGNEKNGVAQMNISFADFPSTLTIFNNLQANGSVFVDPDTGQQITGADINAQNYTLRWFSVKYQANGWRVSGVLLKNGVIVAPEEPEYLVANLRSYSPQYIALKEAIAPTRGAHLAAYVFTPVVQEGAGAVATAVQPAPPIGAAAIVGQPVVAQAGTPAAEVIADEETPLAGGVSTEAIEDEETPLAGGISSEEPSGSWALLNLILMVLTVLLLLIFPKNEEREDAKVQYRTNVLGIGLALAAIAVFIFTENVHLPMVIVDQWTLLMGVIAAAAIVIKVFSHKKVEEKAEAEA